MSSASPTPLPHALDAERVEFEGRAGRLSYYVAGDGEPLLLIHSINAAGSAYEVKPIFDYYRSSRRVYVLDLPGYGFSDRSDRDYTVQLFTDALHDMIGRIDHPTGIDALALSLSSEFLARAASEAPRRFRSLSFITPTGFTAGSEKLREPAGSTREMAWLYNILTLPLWRQGLYRLLVRPGVIRYFLKRTNGSSDYDAGLAAYDDITTHQPDAEHAPYAFLSGKLFSKDIRTIYESLEMPVWLPHATRGDFKDFRGADWMRERSNWTVEPITGGALPHFETPDTFFPAADRFFESISKTLAQ
ncbi:MAG: alpha/beta hydrolase [Pseudomonadota bacterium]